jgi:hypothetical protein
MTLDEARDRIGAGVVYRPYPSASAEDGDITSVNDSYVFVRFVGDRQAKACRAEDLELTCQFLGVDG